MKHCSILAPLTRLAACGALAAVLAVPLPAAARVGDAALVSVTGQITAVDPATRTVTVRGPQGNEVPLQAGPDVRNFDRIKVGDTMRVDYYESVSIATRAKGSGVPEVRSETVATRAKEGALPQGAVGRSTTITAEIWHIAKDDRTVILQGPQGGRETFHLRSAAAQEKLRTLKEGDLVDFTVTRALAAAVRSR